MGAALPSSRSCTAFQSAKPSASDASYVLNVTMLRDQLCGTGIHSDSEKKTGFVRMRHPITKSPRTAGSARRYLMMRRRMSVSELAPFASLNASQAREHGITLAYV